MNRKKIKPLFKKIKEVLTLEEVLKFIFLILPTIISIIAIIISLSKQ